MNFIELAKKRYSVRNFQSKKVEKEKLLKVLQAGRVAPTGGNKQPYRLLVVQESEGLEKLKKAADVYGAQVAIIVCGDLKKAWQRPFDGKNLMDIDASIVTDHMMLQATELDLGSVWICYFKPDVIKAEFKLPDNLQPINILAIGYADGEAASPDRHNKTRDPFNEIVVNESF